MALRGTSSATPMKALDMVQGRVFVITGFGAFGSVTDNPTMRLIHALSEQLPELRTPDGEVIPIRYQVLEVATDYCERFLAQIAEDYADREVIFLHFGVNSSAKTINVERCCYNLMDFSIPDTSGRMVTNAAIHSSMALDQRVETAWPVDEIVKTLHAALRDAPVAGGPEAIVTLSEDPGRFLCNYIYFRSTLYRNRHGFMSRSLFVHMPPFAAIEQPIQERVAMLLISCLHRQLPPAPGFTPSVTTAPL